MTRKCRFFLSRFLLHQGVALRPKCSLCTLSVSLDPVHLLTHGVHLFLLKQLHKHDRVKVITIGTSATALAEFDQGAILDHLVQRSVQRSNRANIGTAKRRGHVAFKAARRISAGQDFRKRHRLLGVRQQLEDTP